MKNIVEQPGSDSDTLTIVIPALNEEEAISSTIERTLSASPYICERGGLRGVSVVVVSDGSTDRTPEIAKSYSGIKVIVFEKNQGYGAAIKAGWNASNAEYLAFIDADGTCDPIFFGELCRAIKEEKADVALGSRMGANSKMPPVRRLGNRIFAFILGICCGRFVTDTASGMRVVRKDALTWLYPLPNGLHFTPSMSARALLNDLRVIEIPMSYEERIGRSKLSVIRDGVRFFNTIAEGVMYYRPESPLMFAGTATACLSLLFALTPVEFYISNRRLEEWMIYRFTVCLLFSTIALMSFQASALTSHVARLGPKKKNTQTFWVGAMLRIIDSSIVPLILFSIALGIFFLSPGLREYIRTGHVTLHWSRLLAGAFAILIAAQSVFYVVIRRTLTLWTSVMKDQATV